DLPDLPVAVRLVNQTGGVPSALGFQDDVRSERVGGLRLVGIPPELVTGLTDRTLGQFAVLVVAVLEQGQVNNRRIGSGGCGILLVDHLELAFLGGQGRPVRELAGRPASHGAEGVGALSRTVTVRLHASRQPHPQTCRSPDRSSTRPVTVTVSPQLVLITTRT